MAGKAAVVPAASTFCTYNRGELSVRVDGLPPALALLLIHSRVRFGLSKNVIRRCEQSQSVPSCSPAVMLNMKSQWELSVAQPLRLMLTG